MELGIFSMMKRHGKSKEMVQKPENICDNDGLTEVPDTGGNTADVIIVGAGVAGAALAYTLAKDGRRVHVLERDLSEPDRIVGEVLHPGGYLKLVELGLEDCVEGIEAQRVSGYVFYLDGKNIRLDYPLGKFDSNVKGNSFHNGRFIQRMRNKASFLPNVKLEQGTVTSLLKTQGTVNGVQYKTKGGHAMTAYAPLTVVCDGCFSNLRRELCNPKHFPFNLTLYVQIKVPSCFVALVLENVDLPYANHAHVFIADPSPVMFYSISNTKIRCLVDVPGEKVPSISNGEMTKYLKTVVAPQIPQELYNAFVAAVDSGNIRTMPNKTMRAEPKATPGALLLGDALNMRHPLTGGGMTVALTDIVLLRDLLRPLHNLNDAYKHLQRFYTLRKASWFDFQRSKYELIFRNNNKSWLIIFLFYLQPMSFTLNTLASVVYKIFCTSSDPTSQELRSVCFDYMSLGRMFADGPMSIFSGLDQRPVALFVQGASLGVYIAVRLLLPFPSPKRLWQTAKLIPVSVVVAYFFYCRCSFKWHN
ncbi:hypothetical protein OSB04_030774 [Centaurea solstitialis]|uniref:Squalene monooxygenase n=1 Tax=Centaurea solstitialis TaxID=347529 RepID=A0AA38W7H7_9ASTR|nr:hypothetical protein OSB04_030774 [Centaurea solstitialis]